MKNFIFICSYLILIYISIVQTKEKEKLKEDDTVEYLKKLSKNALLIINETYNTAILQANMMYMKSKPIVLEAIKKAQKSTKDIEPYARNITKSAKELLEKSYNITNEKFEQFKETEIYQIITDSKTYHEYGNKIIITGREWSNYIYYASLEVFNTVKNMVDFGVETVKERLNQNKEEL